MASTADFRFKDRYKTTGIGTSEAARIKRAEDKRVNRRNSRVAEFSRRRNLADCVEPLSVISEQPPADPVKLKLEKWKQMKKEQHEKQRRAAKPAFKVGIVRHHPASPYLRDISNIGPANFKFQFKATEAKQTIPQKSTPSISILGSIKKTEENPFRRVTRAQTRNAQAKKPCTPGRPKPHDVKPGTSRNLFNIGTPLVASKIGVRTPARPEFRNVVRSTPARPEFKYVKSKPATQELKRNVVKPTAAKQELEMNLRTEFPPANQVLEIDIKTVVGTPVTSELQRKVIDTGVTENAESELDCASVSPQSEVVSTSTRNEAEVHTPVVKKREETFPIQYSPFVTTSRGRFSRRSQLSIPSPKPPTPEDTQKHGIVYFRSVLESEIERLTKLCEEWQNTQQSVSDIPPDVIDLIDNAVGQTQLLMRKKFCQFRGLIERCELSNSLEVNEAIVTCTDLDGFWEMMYLQIENVDLRFRKLEELKQNSWVEKEAAVEVGRKRPVRKTRKAQKPTQSSLRAFISAARQKQQIVLPDNIGQGTPMKNQTSQINDSLTNKSTPVLSCHSRVSFLQDEHRRQSRGLGRRDSSPIIMKVTQMAKMLDGSLVSSQTSDNSAQSVPITPMEMKEPRKSILKSARQSQMLVEQSQNINEYDMDIDVSCRRSSRQSTARKVRFEGAGDSSPKPVHPMTPYVSQERKRKRSRVSLLNNEAENDRSVTQLPSGDLISFDSPVAEPQRVRRRSSRLSNQTRLSYA